jgi:hypothetical protein
MSVRLRLASIWMPRSAMIREIDRIRSRTDAALDALLAEHEHGTKKEEIEEKGRRPEDLRMAMAQGHERKVRALIEKVGRDRAISLGREALYRTGVELGKEAKDRLGVKDTEEDLLRAARIIYRILGIDFRLEDGPSGEIMVVTSCALSHHYSHESCIIMSAVDEGTVHGLCPMAGMQFLERMTDGSSKCVARLDFLEQA